MISKFRSSGFGTLIAIISIAASGISTAHAETVMTVKGVDIDSTVFDAFQTTDNLSALYKNVGIARVVDGRIRFLVPPVQ